LRTKAAPKLSETIRRNLRHLGFRQSELEAKLDALDEPRSNGFDAVELLFSPNPGEPLKPLRAIASSGEISRLMLAIKSALAAHDAIPLLVFDEIDTNVGGEIAHAVGAKMQTLGRDHQVICITHLPQVAATASSHFVGERIRNYAKSAGRDDRKKSRACSVAKANRPCNSQPVY
ncbi:MAG: DNA repair protein RecN, partial [Verrucomicrobia bacterium]